MPASDSNPGGRKRDAPETDDVASKKAKVQVIDLIDDALSDDEANKLADEASAIELARRILKRTWGFDGFRLKQEKAITRLILGGNAIVVFPTGGGKSLVYQVPAIAFDEWDEMSGLEQGGSGRPGVALVVSPLIALMKDQVDALKARGIAAAANDSSQTIEHLREVNHQLESGQLKLLYCTPEKLNNEAFVAKMKGTRIRMVAIDEAHCISEWGHAFRPDYLKIARFVKEVDAERVLCLTATAAPQVVVDIEKAFDVAPEGVFKTTTYRQNLNLSAASFDTWKNKFAHLIPFLEANPGPSIVYVALQAHTEEVSSALKKAGFTALGYHAGMPSDVRSRVQDTFMKSSNIIIVATIAFGMGIDKANIRNVVHFTMPKSLEGYSQEIGRAGRDNLPSNCLCYLCPEDLRQIENFSRADVPSLGSLRGMLLSFFGTNKSSIPGDIVEASNYELSRDWDISMNTLGLLFAQLELRFDLIRAITPKYSKYEYEIKGPLEPNDSTTSALRQASNSKKKWTSIDIDHVRGINRDVALKRLQDWHDSGKIILKATGTVARYRVLNPLPKTPVEQEEIVMKVYKQMEDKEAENIGRVKAVIALLTSAGCISRLLATHFGDQDTVPEKGCGHCGYCKTGIKIEFDLDSAKKNSGGGGVVDHQRLKKVIDHCKDAVDDPRFLARVAWGISSPRTTKLKLKGSPVWESMMDCDFEELVKAFAALCEEAV